MGIGHRFDRCPRMGEEFDRVVQHVLTRSDEFADHTGRDPFIGHFDRGFDHRQDKAFDAETIMPQIAPFGGQKLIG